VLIVTTPEPLAVMDAYAAIKVHAEGTSTPVHVLVNHAADTQQAADAQQRVARVCYRFLGLTTRDAGYLPILPAATGSGAQKELFVLHSPDSTAARYVDRLAATLIRSLSEECDSERSATKSAGCSAARASG
jgi:flagellar biosynthesis protein FlhG